MNANENKLVSIIVKKINDGINYVAIDEIAHLHQTQSSETLNQELKQIALNTDSGLILTDKFVTINRIKQLESQLTNFLFSRFSAKLSEPLELNKTLAKYIFDFNFNIEQQKIITDIGKHGLFVINGGPGSGKSYLLLRIILLILLNKYPNNVDKIVVSCYTAKAKKLLQSGFNKLFQQVVAKYQLKIAEPFLELVEFKTIHSLLSLKPDSFNSEYINENKLDIDWLIIDEASMINSELLKLILKSNHANIIFCGDSEQLPPISGDNLFIEMVEFLKKNNNFAEYRLGELKINNRVQSNDSKITNLLDAIKANTNISIADLKLSGHFIELDENDSLLNTLTNNHLINPMLEHARELTNQTILKNALDLSNQLKILTFNRYKNNGCNYINSYIGNEINSEVDYYHGLPIILKTSNYNLELYNGEQGIVWRDEDQLVVYFNDNFSNKSIDANIQNNYESDTKITNDTINTNDRDNYQTKIAINSLPDYMAAYAFTVYEAQGSEYDNVIILLAEVNSQLNNKKMLYTAISRAKKSFTIIGNVAALEQCLTIESNQYYGLFNALQNKLDQYTNSVD